MVESKKYPRIAVLIPVYNAEKTVQRTLDSLNANKFPHDIILVDDGSKIPIKTVIKPQKNIIIIRCKKNVGITRALNKGLEYILDRPYEFVARMDADDVCAPDRFKKQCAFLDKNRDHGLVGSRGRFVSEKYQLQFYMNYPTDNKTIQKKLFYQSFFFHPMLMIRSSILCQVGGYYELYAHAAEDYELIRRIAKHSKIANLPDYLIDYTVSLKGISRSKRRAQLINRLRIQWQYRDWKIIHFYFGILRTLAIMCTPTNFLTWIKIRLYKDKKRNYI